MYLTRFRFNTARRGARDLLEGPQRIHAAVLHGFPDPERLQDESGRVLWRVDQTSRHDALLYIASPDAPDLTHLVEEAGWPARSADDGWDTRSYDKLLARLENGQLWAFRLTANPTRHQRVRQDGPRVWTPLIDPGQQLQWLLDRSQARGFTILSMENGEPIVAIQESSWLYFTKLEGRRAVTLRSATFEGLLKVSDADALRRSLTFGIGRARAYGCGMLTLAPLHGGR
ncbi:type I-E CRISPR-associated protein Cas6/Cse3/CasE [Glycomyces endophyticus]|uniref:Type I-E CRISPR-associated protein Cas6/Cse3/CasE n=1 Tax=Glycomyces endophyticus TaxID=480996 RepID=A0ABP4RWM1_9ACTN